MAGLRVDRDVGETRWFLDFADSLGRRFFGNPISPDKVFSATERLRCASGERLRTVACIGGARIWRHAPSQLAWDRKRWDVGWLTLASPVLFACSVVLPIVGTWRLALRNIAQGHAAHFLRALALAAFYIELVSVRQ